MSITQIAKKPGLLAWIKAGGGFRHLHKSCTNPRILSMLPGDDWSIERVIYPDVKVSNPSGKKRGSKIKQLGKSVGTKAEIKVACGTCDGCRHDLSEYWSRMVWQEANGAGCNRIWFGTFTFGEDMRSAWAKLPDSWDATPRNEDGSVKLDKDGIPLPERTKTKTEEMLDQAGREWAKAIQRGYKRGIRFSFLAVLELHEDGTPHVHFLMFEFWQCKLTKNQIELLWANFQPLGQNGKKRTVRFPMSEPSDRHPLGLPLWAQAKETADAQGLWLGFTKVRLARSLLEADKETVSHYEDAWGERREWRPYHANVRAVADYLTAYVVKGAGFGEIRRPRVRPSEGFGSGRWPVPRENRRSSAKNRPERVS